MEKEKIKYEDILTPLDLINWISHLSKEDYATVDDLKNKVSVAMVKIKSKDFQND